MSILEIYAVVTVLSFIVLIVVTNWFTALLICGWIGLFAAVFINEVTPGYTME